MLLMLAEVLHLPQLADRLLKNDEAPLSAWQADAWRTVKLHTDHVEWAGCSLHDLIQPAFSFLVGAAMAFSVASRRARGDSILRMALHAAWRAALLVWLGIFLRSIGQKQTNWIFTDTLSQIGLGYLFLFTLGLLSSRWTWAAVVVILAGYWTAWALHPAPAEGFDYKSMGVPADWPHHFQGFMAHWNKNSNLGSAFDQWFLNLFPREKEFTFNRGGYGTLNFIPTLATMALGLIAGQWLRRTQSRATPADGVDRPASPVDPTIAPASRGLPPAYAPSHQQYSPSATRPVHRKPAPPLSHLRASIILLMTGGVCLIAGWSLQHFGVCPIVKRIWTPAWTLYSGGWCFVILAAFYLALDFKPTRIGRGIVLPLLVLGMNSIMAYVLAHTLDDFIAGAFKTHLGADVFKCFGEMYEQTTRGGFILAIYWLMLFWMYRQRVFVRI